MAHFNPPLDEEHTMQVKVPPRSPHLVGELPEELLRFVRQQQVKQLLEQGSLLPVDSPRLIGTLEEKHKPSFGDTVKPATPDQALEGAWSLLDSRDAWASTSPINITEPSGLRLPRPAIYRSSPYSLASASPVDVTTPITPPHLASPVLSPEPDVYSPPYAVLPAFSPRLYSPPNVSPPGGQLPYSPPDVSPPGRQLVHSPPDVSPPGRQFAFSLPDVSPQGRQVSPAIHSHYGQAPFHRAGHSRSPLPPPRFHS
eukprot:jgi/Botrbrau1/20649/Bobra.113_1s0073.1